MVKKLVDYVLAASCGAFSLFLKARFAPTDTSPPAFVLPALGAVALFFVDCHEQPFRMEIRLERIRRELIKQLIGRRTLEIGHRKTFVKKYHARQSTVGGTED